MKPIQRRHFLGAVAAGTGAALSSAHTPGAHAAALPDSLTRTAPVTGRVIDTHMRRLRGRGLYVESL